MDTPDNQRLTATTVTGSIDAFHGRLVGASTAVCVGKDVTASVPTKLKRIDSCVLRTKETKSQETEVTWEAFLTTWDLVHLPLATGIKFPSYAHGLEGDELATFVLFKFSGGDAVFSRVIAPLRLDFGMAVIRTEDTRPLRPWVVFSTRLRWLREQLEVDN